MRLFHTIPCLSLGFLVLFSSVRYGSTNSPADSLGRINLFTKLPLVLFLLSSESQAATVWIPEDTPADTDGSVLDEYAEVAHVFAKPDAKLVKVKPEEPASEQAVPWTSLKQEWELYKKYHKKPASEESEEEEEEEDDEPRGPPPPQRPPGEEEEDEEDEEEEEDDKSDALPIAFYGQQNADDDEKEYDINQKRVNQKTKKTVPAISSDESDEEQDDGPSEESQGQQSDSPDSLDDIPDEVRESMVEKMTEVAANNGGVYDPNQHIKQENPQNDEDQDEEDDSESSPIVRNTKGEGDDDVQDEEGGKGKGKGKGKKKKKKKKSGGGGGWGWKQPPKVIYVPTGGGWKKGHNGVLEQMVKGSTWERILNYYHMQNDENDKHHGHGHGWQQEKDHSTKIHEKGQGLVKKLFKGSFWERAVMTYGQYKRNQRGKPAKEMGEPPLSIEW